MVVTADGSGTFNDGQQHWLKWFKRLKWTGFGVIQVHKMNWFFHHFWHQNVQRALEVQSSWLLRRTEDDEQHYEIDVTRWKREKNSCTDGEKLLLSLLRCQAAAPILHEHKSQHMLLDSKHSQSRHQLLFHTQDFSRIVTQPNWFLVCGALRSIKT